MSQKHNRDSEQNVIITSPHPWRRDGVELSCFWNSRLVGYRFS